MAPYCLLENKQVPQKSTKGPRPDWPIRLPLLPRLPSSLHVLSVPNKGSDAQMAAPWAC